MPKTNSVFQLQDQGKFQLSASWSSACSQFSESRKYILAYRLTGAGCSCLQTRVTRLLLRKLVNGKKKKNISVQARSRKFLLPANFSNAYGKRSNVENGRAGPHGLASHPRVSLNAPRAPDIDHHNESSRRPDALRLQPGQESIVKNIL
jgi:hypothetical protein